MLYLGQLCKYRATGEEITVPAIFLGFARENDAIIGCRIYSVDPDGKSFTEHNVTVGELGFFRIPDNNSPTGKSVYFGDCCTYSINEYTRIKVPKEANKILRNALNTLPITGTAIDNS